jgi:methyl-accepting chemotaxis protein
MFMKFRLSVKLIGGFAVVALVTLVVGYAGWHGVNQSLKATERIDFLDNISKQILKREIDHLNWARKVGEFQRQENLTKLGVQTDDHQCAFGKWYYSNASKDAEAAIPELAPLLKQVEEPHKKLHASARHLEDILKKGPGYRPEAVAYYQSETVAQLKIIQKILAKITPVVDQQVAAAQKDTARITDRSKDLAGGGMVLGTVLSLALGIFLSQSITRPINRVVSGLNEGAAQVASASDQVSSSSQSMAQGASQQATAIEESSSSLEELASMTRQNAQNADQANVLMGETAQVVDDANRAMATLTGAMEDISLASQDTAKIVKTIDEIAFQTNLLALNAAVEAARAGEAGAGFAVVADEVRNLAMRAAEAAKNTANLIASTVTRVKEGTEVVHQTAAAFSQLSQGAGKVKDLVKEIASASQEQAQGVDQINRAVSEMNQVTQGVAANAEESASASEELNAQSLQMREFVGELVVLVNGDGASGLEKKYLPPDFEAKLPTRLASLPKSPHSRGQKTGEYLPRLTKVSPQEIIPLEEDNFRNF